MSTERLRERAQGWANRLAVYFELSGKDKCDTAQLLRDLCAEIERLEKENGALREAMEKARDYGQWAIENGHDSTLFVDGFYVLVDAIRGEGGKG